MGYLPSRAACTHVDFRQCQRHERGIRSQRSGIQPGGRFVRVEMVVLAVHVFANVVWVGSLLSAVAGKPVRRRATASRMGACASYQNLPQRLLDERRHRCGRVDRPYLPGRRSFQAGSFPWKRGAHQRHLLIPPQRGELYSSPVLDRTKCKIPRYR